MEIISITEIWRWFRWLPKLILKRIFKKERLSDLVYIDIKPRGDSARVQLSEDSSYSIHFQIINMTPFEIELDRAEFHFNFAGTGINNKHLRKYNIKSGQIFDLLVTDSIDGDKANIISKLQKDNESSVVVYCVFNCLLHSFEKQDIHLNGINVKFAGPRLNNT